MKPTKFVGKCTNFLELLLGNAASCGLHSDRVLTCPLLVERGKQGAIFSPLQDFSKMWFIEFWVFYCSSVWVFPTFKKGFVPSLALQRERVTYSLLEQRPTTHRRRKTGDKLQKQSQTRAKAVSRVTRKVMTEALTQWSNLRKPSLHIRTAQVRF